MNTPSMISVTTLRLFLEAVERTGIAPEGLLRACNIEASSLEDSEVRIPQSTYEFAFQQAERLSGDAAIGLHAGEHVHARAVNLFGYLMLSSATLLDGLHRVVRYQSLLTDAPWVKLDDSSKEIRVIVDRKALDPAIREIHAEYMLAMLLAVLRWVSETDIRPLSIHYEHGPRADIAEYERVMKGVAHFHCDSTEMLFTPETLALPSQHHDRAMEQLHVGLAEWLLATKSDRTVSGEVRRALSQRLEAGVADLETVARYLGMSTRSLQRRLAEEGSTFRSVLDRLRKDLAREHLEHLGTPVAEVAFLTGFSEVSAFTRAMRRWFGRTPGRMRREVPTESTSAPNPSA
jgi:AraC-like DNA-binding protein